jgi:hypothetical protein
VGYRARERKRRQRIAQGRAQATARRSGTSATGWWLTRCRSKTCCARCAGILAPGAEMIYRREPRESLCVPCADRAGIQYQPALAWLRGRRGSRS